MHKILCIVLASTLLSPLAAPAQGAGADRKQGTIYKNEVDGLVDALRKASRRGGVGDGDYSVLGSDALVAGKVLVAMGHCHRRYHVSDGPVVRPTLDHLLRCRRSDGSFGDVAATAWVAQALDVMDADGFREEVAAARRWLDAQDADAPSFDARVQAVLDDVRADRFPQHLAADAARRANAWFDGGAVPDAELGQAADALLQLVACQVANRVLDAQQDPEGSGEAAWWPTQQKAFAWLWQQQEDGVFSVPVPMTNEAGERVAQRVPDVALTGFGLMALQTKPKARRTAAEQAAIEKGLRWLLERQNDDGTFDERVPNYTTCVVVGALTRWQDPAAAPVLQKAQKAILMFQNSETGGYTRSDRDYGSIGYGNSQRGDLSNLHFSLEALRATGLPENHEAMQRALVFLQRTQNLKSVNDFSGKVPDPDRDGVILDVTSGDDGGAAYYPGNSAAGYIVRPDGKAIPRSYGSMTYALLKSYTLAGVDRDDPRVAAAVKWIQDNWTQAMNYGAAHALGEQVKYQSLSYYYMAVAQPMGTAGIERIVQVERKPTAEGGEQGSGTGIDWRAALREQLAGMQQDDGSWVNGKNERWMEGLPLLCTCYAMVALEHCR